jgi:bifunctional DNA-binding transcriptional regulator/antitoxin component of YhaV-PrlF toxin-antitoxin module
VVEIDERGRVTIPKAMRAEADRALIIPMGESYLVVPIPKAPVEFEMKETGRSVKEIAEKRMMAEARARMARRRQR